MLRRLSWASIRLRGRPSPRVLTLLCALFSLVSPTLRPAHAGTPAARPDAIQQPLDPPNRTGSISGSVTGPEGALVKGAQVKLSLTGRAGMQETVTNTDGRFAFPEAATGDFTVTVSLAGFDPASATGNLQAGQNLVLPPFALQMSTVNFTVDAVVDVHQLALEEMHLEEKQRIAGILPNFFVSYDWHAPALTSRQKFSLATKNATDPGNLLLVGTVAGVQQAENAFPGYHQGAKGYGRRYGADLANLVVGTYMGGAVLPSLFHQDPRYFYKGTGSFKSRFLYALSTAVICRGDNGHRQPAFAGVLGDLSAGAISNIYYAPSDRQGARLTLINGFLGVAGDAMNNVFQEFVLRKVTPRLAKQSSVDD